jgi:hypothetical protein
MDPSTDPSSRAVDMTMLASLGSSTVAQELVGRFMDDIDGVDADLVVEETLCLVATVGARALEFGVEENDNLRELLVASMLELPFSYCDYLLGRAVLEGVAEHSDAVAEQIAGRLSRKMEFYAAQLPLGQFPSERKIQAVMELWMGRISPRGLEELPSKRLRRLDLVSDLDGHAKLVLAYAKRLTDQSLD